MLEFEDILLGQQDLLSNKYYSTLNICPSPTTMDLLLNAGDSISFQEMLDLDIKNEIDTVLGGHNDFSSFNFNFADAPPLDLDESPSELNMWFTGSNSNSNFNDFIGSDAAAMMVNPNSVMPLALVTVPPKSSSPINIKSPSPIQKISFPIMKISEIETDKKNSKIKVSSPVNKFVNKNQSLVNIKNAIQKQLVNSANITGLNSVRMVQNSRKQQFNTNRHFDDVKVYPKPAYSYSCLIAMALKNSRNGSLPVSEIYNFMCEHFPYFKTAPNGWKNSVRHNLSLNKCFEKIEKPAVSGAQRKGCLWAMNPAKISKMDDEVQKWSRKDPLAIRKAMINPEHLEALERGELKYTCRSRSHSEDDAEDTEDDAVDYNTEPEQEDATEDEGTDAEELEELDLEELDVEVADTFYTTDDASQTIKIEMEVVENELLESSYTPSRKRNRDVLEIGENFTRRRLYHLQPPTRRKTAYLIKNE